MSSMIHIDFEERVREIETARIVHDNAFRVLKGRFALFFFTRFALFYFLFLYFPDMTRDYFFRHDHALPQHVRGHGLNVPGGGGAKHRVDPDAADDASESGLSLFLSFLVYDRIIVHVIFID